jgi:outer membrane lipoprotein LolB
MLSNNYQSKTFIDYKLCYSRVDCLCGESVLRAYCLILLWIGCSVLVGCVIAPQTKCTQLSWQQQQATLASLTHWQLSGSLHLKHHQHQEQLNFFWHQQGTHFKMIFSGPLGFGAVSLKGMINGRVCLDQGKDQVHCAIDIAHLMQQALGWSLPVQTLVYWVKGQVVGPYTKKSSTHGLLKSLYHNADWIYFRQYQCVSGIRLPGQVELHTAQGMVTLTIDSWQLSTNNNQRKIKTYII